MTKIALPVTILAAAMLAACAGPRSPAAPSSSASAQQSLAYRAGSGVVQSVSPAPTLASAGASAPSAGASATTDSGLQRLAIRMDNGSTVYVDTTSRDFPVGTRVRLTEDRLIEKQ